MNRVITVSSLTLALALAACAPSTDDQPDPVAEAHAEAAAQAAEAAASAEGLIEPADEFLIRLAEHCGQAFAGRIVANEPASPEPDAFEGQDLVMHVRGCEEPTREIRVPFHVGDNHSRTWILTRTEDGLRLKHDHRLEDGSDDPVTMYGGDTVEPGTAQRQEFPVDQESIELFSREGLDVSTTNVWAMEIEPGQRFLYELARPEGGQNPEGRLFQVEFDLTQPVETPPTPWGY
ncbi:hypothetical protein BGP89_01685 [Luteimonas sp. JM171]|uniref:hypothetical protein n=1 Tax=Luteimonas sp. JM171 TaxID=1896164 RepID=UPI00085596C9|nr:hypothetical protein [Luteimonas sp. JM171]AOH35226.1 hypothetical protein BGP89_01685 [Luteimonas sp. JM171]